MILGFQYQQPVGNALRGVTGSGKEHVPHVSERHGGRSLQEITAAELAMEREVNKR